MSYWDEVRDNWRALAAASLGLSAGFMVISYFNNHFVPPLLREFGWTSAQLSLVGLTVLLPAVCLPVVGRFTDLFGVKRVAMIGVIGSPLIFIAMSVMTGEIWQYYLLTALQSIVVGATTTSLVYSRLIAERFNVARGFAVGLAAAAPAIVGAVSSPLLAGIIAEYGWRAGYLAVAAWTGLAGALALLLIAPRHARPGPARATGSRGLRLYAPLFRNRVFLLITAGILLCNIPYIMYGLHLKNILLGRSVDGMTASWMISLFALGVVGGRLACGLALDRYAPPIVAAITLGLPSLGLAILASGTEVEGALALATAILGLSLGAEADVLAYLVMRYFGVDEFGTVFGIVLAAATVSTAAGSLLLSVTLTISGGFDLFLILSAISVFAGSLLYLFLGRPAASAIAPTVQPQRNA